MNKDVYIIGATGNVGRELVHQLLTKRNGNNENSGRIRISGLASSKDTIYSPNGLSAEQAYSFLARQNSEFVRYDSLTQLLSFARHGYRDDRSNLVFVDVTPLDEPMRDFHLHVIEQTPYGIVTANKNPIALASYDIFQRLTRDPNRYGYRCSVMAGAHAVPVIQELTGVGDKIRIIEGCFSGTLGYIPTMMEQDASFSEALEGARTRHYTETDPRQDLSGRDVARKLIVIARTMGIPVELSHVRVDPFIPEQYLSNGNIDQFLASVEELNPYFAAKINKARAGNMTLRYVGRIDTTGEQPTLQVSLVEVPKQSVFGGLEGTLNALIVETETHPGDKALTFRAQGAGPNVTAQNIRVDLNNVMR